MLFFTRETQQFEVILGFFPPDGIIIPSPENVFFSFTVFFSAFVHGAWLSY
jgi:hypothetical protein